MLNNEILNNKVNEVKDWVINVRRDFHMYPEIGFEEYKTRDKIIQYLEQMNIEYKIIAKTGIVGIIRGGKNGKTVALRADMDALPVEEQNDVPYKSKVEGKMHACGHDAHTAVLLGTAKILNEIKAELKGNVKLIFQPAEETTGGAKPMIDEGVMDNPKVDGIFGLHVDNEIDAGKIGIKYGQMYASSDMINIIIHGNSSHGAYPHLGTDAISIASQVISGIQTIISRNVDPRNSAVISLGTIKGGYARNVIADKVEIQGIVRTLDPVAREEINNRLKDIVERIPETMGGSGEYIRMRSYTSLINNDDMVDIVCHNVQEILGDENVVKIKYANFGVEDFAYYTEVCNAAFFHLGSRNISKNIVQKLHNPKFDIDEECLKYGVLVQVKNVLAFLND